jgi:transcription elongation factor GreA
MNQKKTLMTEEGLRKLQEELHTLKTVRRKEVAEAIQAAKEQGDLSENAEYVDAKDRQGLVEQRIAELEALLKNVEVIQKGNSTDVNVGNTVTLEVGGNKTAYTIVGANEANPAEGRISNESPLGRSLIGKKAGDDVSVRTPSGNRNVKVLSVR